MLSEAYKLRFVEEPTIVNLVISDFETSEAYIKPKTTLLLRLPRAYPDAGLDMFWTDEDLTLKDGGIPNGAGVIEQYPALDELSDLRSKRWRRFSWHPQFGNPAHWNPNVDNLLSYLEFVKRRFRLG